MKYILSGNGEPGILYGRYLEYLKTIEHFVPAHVFLFASSEKHFSLDSPHSLHDSWLTSIDIREIRSEVSAPEVEITLRLLGQRHDRTIILKYENVIDYVIQGRRDVKGQIAFRYADAFHGDLITHEVRLSPAGNLMHEMAFATDSSLLIECKNFTHSEELSSLP